MKPRVATHERVRELQPCERREHERKLERRNDARAVAIGYLANPSIRLDKRLEPELMQVYAGEIVALADAMSKALDE